MTVGMTVEEELPGQSDPIDWRQRERDDPDEGHAIQFSANRLVIDDESDEDGEERSAFVAFIPLWAFDSEYKPEEDDSQIVGRVGTIVIDDDDFEDEEELTAYVGNLSETTDSDMQVSLTEDEDASELSRRSRVEYPPVPAKNHPSRTTSSATGSTQLLAQPAPADSIPVFRFGKYRAEDFHSVTMEKP